MNEDTPADTIRDLIRRLEMQANTARGAFDEALSLLTGKTST